MVFVVIDNGYLDKETNEYEVEEILDKCFCKDRVRMSFCKDRVRMMALFNILSTFPRYSIAFSLLLLYSIIVDNRRILVQIYSIRCCSCTRMGKEIILC